MNRRLWFYGSVAFALASCVLYATSMPGASYAGELPASTPALRELAARLSSHVTHLAGTIGSRNLAHPAQLMAAREYLALQLKPLETASNQVQFEDVSAPDGLAQNVIFEIAGKDRARIVTVGAHYDSVDTGPGANDNGSGVAAGLELAAVFARSPAPSNVRFVFFVNEEPPYFKTAAMGSRVNADNARRRGDAISAMLSLETIGYYRDSVYTQHYPWPIGLLYPSRGNFVGFVGDLGSRALVRSAIQSFRNAEQFPSEGAALPSAFPGIDWSDHWSYRQVGYPAILITDTALYRDPNYHRATDTPEKLCFDCLARVTRGVEAVVRGLAR